VRASTGPSAAMAHLLPAQGGIRWLAACAGRMQQRAGIVLARCIESSVFCADQRPADGISGPWCSATLGTEARSWGAANGDVSALHGSNAVACVGAVPVLTSDGGDHAQRAGLARVCTMRSPAIRRSSPSVATPRSGARIKNSFDNFFNKDHQLAYSYNPPRRGACNTPGRQQR
jgi:hypothetical protein